MGCLKIQPLQTALVYLVHLVVSPGKIPEFVRSRLGDRAVRLDLIDCIQHRPNTKSGGNPHHDDNPYRLQDNDHTDKRHFPAERTESGSIRVIGHGFQLVQAVPHIFPDTVFLRIVVIIMNHLRSPLHFHIRRKRPVLFRKLHLVQNIGIIRNPLCPDHEIHGVIFPVHQLQRSVHCAFQFLKCSGISDSIEHSGDSLFPALGFKRLPEVIIKELPVSQHSKTLNAFSQIVGRIHQLTGSFSKLDLLF